VKPSVRTDGKRMVVKIPLKFERSGTRKRIVAPDGAPSWAPRSRGSDNTLVKALARAHRWRRMLEGGKYDSITELAAAEKINMSYMCRMLRLTLLSPRITEAILDGRCSAKIDLCQLVRPLPGLWAEQERVLSCTC
jgi:hypothetical protein